jgi:hypothetical protein
MKEERLHHNAGSRSSWFIICLYGDTQQIVAYSLENGPKSVVFAIKTQIFRHD